MLKDSLYSIETNQVAQTMVAEFQFDQQEKEIKLLNSENQVKALELESANKQKQISYAVIGGLGLSSLLLYFFFNSKRKSNQLLEEKNNVISNALKEKDTLLREIHHRVKNNLQVIGSLLRLQSNYTDDENVLQAINEGQSRVRSMALIHQKLYQRENLTGVSTKDYLDQLIKELFSTYKVDTNKIQLQLDIQDINLDIDTVIPIGLVVNELVSNALKYAFVGRDNGILKVSLKEVSEKLVVKVADNGNGIPDLSVVENPSSFGWNLINIFKDKLDGSINIDNTSGTSVEIKFEEYQLVA
jgi:two-component sensor histidine kinase